MARKKRASSTSGKHRIAGYDVRITQIGDREMLFIDERPCRFHLTDAGYVLRDNIYEKPQKTLLAAAKLHLNRSAQ